MKTTTSIGVSAGIMAIKGSGRRAKIATSTSVPPTNRMTNINLTAHFTF
jgi:hypothetical protein